MFRALLFLTEAVLAKDGLSFVLVGDFGDMSDLSRAEKVFDSINYLKDKAQPESPEDFEFFLTVGDNLYPSIPSSPTEDEFSNMMNLFLKRDKIKDLSIYPVRGNHDCLFNSLDKELELQKQYPTWKMPDFWYEQKFDLGNGEKISLMHIDSCFLLCEIAT
jgi:hypothetical protein